MFLTLLSNILKSVRNSVNKITKKEFLIIICYFIIAFCLLSNAPTPQQQNRQQGSNTTEE